MFGVTGNVASIKNQKFASLNIGVTEAQVK